MKIKFKSIWLVPLALFSFMSFISYIAFIKPSKISQLVSNKYYEAEIKYQKVINEKKNAINLKLHKVEIISLIKLEIINAFILIINFIWIFISDMK